jgi:MFS family permease
VTRKVPTVVGLILAFAMAALEATVVSTAMPTVIGDLGGIEYYAWVTNAYLVASSVSVPLYGKLADIYGRKPVLLAGIAMFLLGSGLSGAATSMPSRKPLPARMMATNTVFLPSITGDCIASSGVSMVTICTGMSRVTS